ncbi:hypothetical protein G5714_018009 [Onychostoma macrolepis]|uniref:Uncharacterized protein n=1 Tax=Onychostoma macrolepis TaxID=369639 RepID=A0A7J6C2R6_9TELE|nr:hypothetical protein G5714_018009 [Onychostoma macrolepis]
MVFMEFYRILSQQIKDSDDDYSFHHLDIGIILIEHEGDVLSSSLRLNPASLKIIIEGDFVMDSIEDLSKAMCILKPAPQTPLRTHFTVHHQQSDSTYEEHDVGDHGEELRTLQDALANHKQDINLKLQLEVQGVD